MAGETRTSLAYDLNAVVLDSKPTEQFFTGGNEQATMIFGKAVKSNDWGRLNEVPLDMGNSHGIEPINASNLGFATSGDSEGVRANIQPVTQTAKLQIDGPMMDTLMNASGRSYLETKDQIVNRFMRQINDFQDQALWGRKDGRLCYVYNAAGSTTVYFYGLDGVQLLPDNHLVMDILSGPSRKFDICATADPTTPTAAGVTFSSFDFSASTATCSTSVNLTGTVGTYFVRLYNSKTAITSVQHDGLLDIFQSGGTYLTDIDGNAITTARYPNWRITSKSASSSVLNAEIVERLLSSCVGNRDNKILIADPKVLVRCQDVNGAKQQFVADSNLYMGFRKVFYNMGARQIQVLEAPRWRGTGYCAVVDPTRLKLLGTIIKPRFARPNFVLLEESWSYINDLLINSQMYTDCLRAHAIATSVDNTTTIG